MTTKTLTRPAEKQEHAKAMSAQLDRSATPSIPTLSDFPEWVTAHERLNGLRDKLQKAEDFLSDGGRQLTDFKKDLEDKKAKALLEGNLAGFQAEHASLKERVQQVFEDIPIIQRAISMAEEQLKSVTREISGRVCAKLRPAHQVVAQKIALALRELALLNEEEQAIRDALEDGGFRSSLPHMGFSIIGNRKLAEAPLCQHIYDGVEAGYFDADASFVRELKTLHNRR